MIIICHPLWKLCILYQKEGGFWQNNLDVNEIILICFLLFSRHHWPGVGIMIEYLSKVQNPCVLMLSSWGIDACVLMMSSWGIDHSCPNAVFLGHWFLCPDAISLAPVILILSLWGKILTGTYIMQFQMTHSETKLHQRKAFCEFVVVIELVRMCSMTLFEMFKLFWYLVFAKYGWNLQSL